MSKGDVESVVAKTKCRFEGSEKISIICLLLMING